MKHKRFSYLCEHYWSDQIAYISKEASASEHPKRRSHRWLATIIMFLKSGVYSRYQATADELAANYSSGH